MDRDDVGDAARGSVDGCISCATLARPALPPRLRIASTRAWTLAHAFDANLEGWLVLLPHRHVTALDELRAEEAAEIGSLLRDATAALRAVTRCEKTYVLLLAEAPGFSHVHFHVVPRAGDLDEAHRGAKVFSLLGNASLPFVTDERMDEIALAVREQLAW